MHTPYGATECLPVSTIEAAEVLGETAGKTAAGAGVCVGRAFSTVEWRVIRITDQPIVGIDDAEELATGEIGELIVRGPQASPRYVTRTECNAHAKIPDERAGRSSAPTSTWHRMGDVGYFDDNGRFWYCGRKSHRVETKDGELYSECVEAVFNHVPFVRRVALVGVGPKGNQTPVVVFEPKLPRTIFPDPADSAAPRTPEQLCALISNYLKARAAQYPHTARIENFLQYDRFPVDIRHNAKINREWLAAWATTILADRSSPSPAPSP
jgi:acyl-CoA synthetase (AMP-forming)/AMP-acid ligase II